jgi:hypothetical protein
MNELMLIMKELGMQVQPFVLLTHVTLSMSQHILHV